MPDQSENPLEFSTARLEALSDGVFAIAMTLLVFDIRIPQYVLRSEAAEAVSTPLRYLWPHLLAFAISFTILGIYWIGHHNLFSLIHHCNRPVLWLNIYFLMTIGLVPFSSRFIAEYHDLESAVVIYGANLAFSGYLLFAISRYAGTHGQLEESTSRSLEKRAALVILVPAISYTVGALLGLLNPWFSIGLYMFVPVLYLLPRLLEHILVSHHPSTEEPRARDSDR